jgi:TolB protein
MRHLIGWVVIGGLLAVSVVLAGCGGGEGAVTGAEGVDSDGLTAAPTSEKIVFSRRVPNTYSSVVVLMDPDGSNQQALPNDGSDPELSPDGTRIVFLRVGDGYSDLWAMATGGKGRRRLNYWTCYSPAWSPDGTRIAVASPLNSQNPRIVVMRADGTKARDISTSLPQEKDSSPDWSPDGTQIVFARWDGAHSDLWIVNANGTGLHQLTQTTARNTWCHGPNWSPDGARIVFQKQVFRNADLYTIKPDGTDERRVAQMGSTDVSPCWSPDSSRIVFTKRDADHDRADIFVINADGTRLRRLTDTGDSRAPFWWGPQ